MTFAESLDHAKLVEHVGYDEETGKLFWKLKGKKRTPGKELGSKHCNGYRRAGIFGMEFLLHRLVWFYIYGAWPKGDIDHINGVKTDNRKCNLRDIAHQFNAQNRRKPQIKNSSGYLGVSRCSHGSSKFRARIRLPEGGEYLIGTFDSPKDAHEAYLEVKRKIHEGCTI
jgi:hypothetical protein